LDTETLSAKRVLIDQLKRSFDIQVWNALFPRAPLFGRDRCNYSWRIRAANKIIRLLEENGFTAFNWWLDETHIRFEMVLPGLSKQESYSRIVFDLSSCSTPGIMIDEMNDQLRKYITPDLIRRVAEA